jgi:hypothetical protein
MSLKDLYDHDLQRGKPVPYEIALMAVEDPEVEVRQWIARHGRYLDYSERKFVDNDLVYEHTERNLEERLKQDPDPFVCASLRENPNVFCEIFTDAEKDFRESTYMERLALMRNPEIWRHDRLLKKVFDHQDQELGIEQKEREELVLAFLTNGQTLARLQKEAGLSERSDRLSDYGYNKHFAESLLSSLWELAAKWPADKLPAPVPGLIYLYLPVGDKTKEKIYEECNETVLRRLILESCSKRDVETLKLGVRDKDEDCASIARGSVYRFELDDLIETDIAGDEEPSKFKRIGKRVKDWWDRNDLLWSGAVIVIALLLVLFTEEGNRILGRLLEFFSTPFGSIVFWPLLIIVGLFGFLYVFALAGTYRWFFHLLMLSLVGWFYFIAEDSKQVAGIIALFYFGSLVIPKWWEALSDDLTDKIINKLELLKKNQNR